MCQEVVLDTRYVCQVYLNHIRASVTVTEDFVIRGSLARHLRFLVILSGGAVLTCEWFQAFEWNKLQSSSSDK